MLVCRTLPRFPHVAIWRMTVILQRTASARAQAARQRASSRRRRHRPWRRGIAARAWGSARRDCQRTRERAMLVCRRRVASTSSRSEDPQAIGSAGRQPDRTAPRAII
jgi:hypothetical protein